LWLWQKLTASSVMQMILFEFISGTLEKQHTQTNDFLAHYLVPYFFNFKKII